MKEELKAALGIDPDSMTPEQMLEIMMDEHKTFHADNNAMLWSPYYVNGTEGMSFILEGVPDEMIESNIAGVTREDILGAEAEAREMRRRAIELGVERGELEKVECQWPDGDAFTVVRLAKKETV